MRQLICAWVCALASALGACTSGGMVVTTATLAPEAAKPPAPNCEQQSNAALSLIKPEIDVADAAVEPRQKTVGSEELLRDPQPTPLPKGKFRWPVKGHVLANFGARPDKTHNDGVNIAVPVGTEVGAADDGVVAYAGSELKGYGNLVLLRHDKGWVTAYAHNAETLVKRGDKVRRGQTIARAGQSGNADQPQVHFELRTGSKPVDPVPYLVRN